MKDAAALAALFRRLRLSLVRDEHGVTTIQAARSDIKPDGFANGRGKTADTPPAGQCPRVLSRTKGRAVFLFQGVLAL